MAITINLVRDWEDIQLEEFKSFIAKWGFESKTLERYLHAQSGTNQWKELREEAVMTWFNYRRSNIPVRPRTLVHNPSLICPPEVSHGWQMLKSEVTKGIDLTPRLSRKIENADYKDGMLYDWGFHHFHLGTVFDSKHPQLIQGTAFVLLAIVDSSKFYPVDFVQHGKWGDKAILEKAIKAFPDRFEPFQLKGITDIAYPCTDENDIMEIRKLGMNSFVKVDDKVYAPPGGGLTMAGTSVMATIELDKYRHQLRTIEDQVQKHYNSQHHSLEVRLARAPIAGKIVLGVCKDTTETYVIVQTNSNGHA